MVRVESEDGDVVVEMCSVNGRCNPSTGMLHARERANEGDEGSRLVPNWDLQENHSSRVELINTFSA